MKNAKTFFKKALSLFVATLMLLSMCSLCFGVLAEEADYVVEYNNPALPMYEQSTIDLSKVSVEITEGNVVDGSLINWSTYNEAVQIDNAAKTLTIYAEGTYELYASYKGVGKTVVAIVIPADAEGDENGIYEAEIFEYDFTNGTWDDFKKDWLLQRKLSNVSSFLAPAAPQISDKTYSTKGFVPFVASYNDEAGQTVRNCVYYSDGTLNIGYMYLKAGNIVENFSDYNVYATGYLGQLAFSDPSKKSGSGTSRAGILGRAVLNKDGVLDYKSDYQAALTSIVNYGSYTIDGVSAHYNAYMTGKACMVWGYDSKTSSYYGSNVNGIVAGNLYTVYAKYDGNTITTGLTKGDYETATAFAKRTVDSECTQTYRNVSYVAGENGLCVEQSGTVGFMYNGAETQLQKFRVTHNIDLNNMPATLVTEPVNYFTVDSELPYFVMYENTTVDLSKFIVTIEGTGYVGNQVTWSTKDTGITIDAKNSYLTCGSYGDFTITATKGDISTDIYLYVIKEDDTEVNIIDYDFTVGNWEEWSKDWGIQVANRKGANATLNVTWFDPIDTLPVSTYDYAAKGIKGIVPFITRTKDADGNNVNVNIYDHRALGIMYSKNPLIAKMSDYKLTAKTYIYERGFSSTTSTSRSNSAGSAGLIGRIELNNGVVTTDSRYQGFAISWKRDNITNFTATLDKGTPAAESDLVKEVGFGALAISKGVYGHSTINPGQFAAPDGVGGGISDTEMHEQYVTYQSVYSGGSITVGFGLDDTVDADTTTITDMAYRVGSDRYTIHKHSKHNNAVDIGATNAGTVGYMFFGIEEAVQNFKATIALDTARIPETVEIVEPEIEYTEVGATTELRMLPGTNADLALLKLTFGDEKVGGDAIAWTCANSDATIEDGVFTAQKAGAYRLTATYGEQTKDINIYVVAADATEAVIADFDFTDEETKANWNKYFGLNFSTNGKANAVNQTTLPTTSYTNASGIVPFTYNIDGTKYGAQGSSIDKGVYGVFYLKDDFVAGLEDYTVNATFKMFGSDAKAPYNNGGNASHMSGMGIATNIITDENAIVTNSFNLNVCISTTDWKGRLNSIVTENDWTRGKWNQFTSMKVERNGQDYTVTLGGKEVVTTSTTSTASGTVGMHYKGVDFDLHRFKVTHSLSNAIYAPVRVIEEEPEEVEITESINLGVNEVYNLTNATLVFKGNAVAGSAVEWTVPNNNAYELNGTKLYTFAEADFYAVASYKGVEKKIAVSIKNEYNGTNEDAVDMLASLDNGSLSITKYGYGKYLIAVNSNEGYTLKAGSLKANIDGKTIKVTAKTNDAGTSFGFAAESIDGAVISAEFIKDTAADIAMLGGTIRLATETRTSGIRFCGRVSNIKSAKLTDTIVIDGKEYKTLGVGTLMLPSPLLKGELTVDTENVTNKAINKVVEATENYADVAFTLTGIPEGKMRDIKISVRTYVMYEDENGDAQYYYSDVVERSYNEVYDIVYPTVDNAGDIDKIVTVENTNFSGHNKEFAFNLKINGRYTVNYVLNDKDGNQVASGVISSLEAYNQYAKITALGEEIGAYQLILTAKDVDLAGRKNTTDLVGTYTIQVYDEDILISDTQRYLNQQTYAYGNTKGEDTTYLKFTVMSDQHYAWSSYGDGNNTYMNTRRNFAEALNKSDTEFVFMAGDNVDWALSYSGNGNIDTNKNLYVLQEALAPLTQKDIYAVYGNHDTQTPDFAKNLVINAGNVTIIAFTANYQELPSTGTRSTCIVPDSTIEWLKEQSEAALERNPDTHLVFINHYAIQNNTEKFSWPMLYDGDADLAAKKVETLNRNKLLDVITQYGVELYINGHEHNENMNFEEITYENGLGTGCINYNAGWSPTDITIEEYVDANGETKLHVTAEQYKYDSFTSKVDDVSNKVNATVEFDLISNGLTAEETLANAEGFYAADAALRAEYSGKYNDHYSYSFEFAGVETVDGVKCYKFNVSRLLYYIDGSTVVYDAAVTEKKGILRKFLKTVYISGDGTIVK